MHQASRLQLARVQRRVSAAASEVARVHADGPARHSRIAISTGDVRAAHNVGAESARAVSAVESAAPPGMQHFERRQRNPSDAAKTEADAESAAESKEADQSRGPEVVAIDRSRIPGPAHRAIEPAPVVIRGPAPGIVTNPGPSIPVF